MGERWLGGGMVKLGSMGERWERWARWESVGGGMVKPGSVGGKVGEVEVGGSVVGSVLVWLAVAGCKRVWGWRTRSWRRGVGRWRWRRLRWGKRGLWNGWRRGESGVGGVGLWGVERCCCGDGDTGVVESGVGKVLAVERLAGGRSSRARHQRARRTSRSSRARHQHAMAPKQRCGELEAAPQA